MIKKIIITLLISGYILSNDMTPPDIPQILGVSYDGKIVLTWNKVAEESIDAKTGYADFEGYRLYKSTDGGQTWGDIDTDIIPVDTDGDGIGEIVGWRPIARFDLTELQDTTRCIYYNEYEDCDDDPDTDEDESLERKVEISGPDPVAPWFYLGDNLGLNHFYEDEDVINGVEYTYAITAYDMGVKIDTVVISNIDGNITLDTTWNNSNPGHFTCPDGWECPSFESPKLSESFTDYNSNGIWDLSEPFTDENGNNEWDSVRENLINVITITPSATATNITFPSETETEAFILPNESNLGTGEGLYRLVDEASLDPKMIKMEIQANGDEDDFEGFKTRNPELYIYEIDENENLLDGNYASYNINELTDEEISNYLDMPGSAYSSDSTQIHIPTYLIDPLPLMFSDQSGAENNYTQWFSGIQVRFDNYWFELPQTNSYAGINDISYMNIDGTDYEEDLDGNGIVDVFEDFDDDNDLTLAWYLGEYDVAGNWFSISGGKIQLSYWGDGFDARSMFDYKIEFSPTQNLDTAYRVIPNGDPCFDITLSNPDWDGDRDEVSFLPFKVTNITTGRQVRSWHTDKGVYTGDGGSPGADDPGYGDCVWQHNETISFTHDSLAFSDDLDDIDDEKTFELVVEYSMQALRLKYGADIFEGFPRWSEESVYTTDTIIEHAKSMWQAKRDIDPDTEVYPESCGGICEPNSIYDIDGDLVNDNPWQQLYPWDEGDYIIVTPDKWFQDGDSWTADLSLLGAEQELNNSHVGSIMVLPNPYVVSSVYNEELYDSRLKFDNLPNQCTIKIYTITGEHVATIDHNDTGDMANWDMKNMQGDFVSPGLYIYTVEAGSLDPIIGKFVIVK